MKTPLEIINLLDASCDLALIAEEKIDPKLLKMNLELMRGQLGCVVSQAAPQAVPEPNANEQKILFDSIKAKILASLLKDIAYWDLKNDDINECIENVKELFASM